MKRWGAVIMLLLTLGWLFCTPSFAALSVENLNSKYEISYRPDQGEAGSIKSSESGNDIAIECNPECKNVRIYKAYFKQSAQLILTNNYSYPSQLSYLYSEDTGNKGSTDTALGKHTGILLQPGASHIITITTGNSGTNYWKADYDVNDPKPAKYKLTNISLVPDSVPVHAVVKLQNDDGTLADHPEAGTATVSAGTIQLGTDATFTATASEGYDFVEWRFDGESYSKEASFTKTIKSYDKDENGSYVGETLIAVFRKAAQNVMVNVKTAPEGNVGTVTASVDGTSLPLSDGQVAVPANKTVVLTAEEVDGYIFAGWLKEDGTQYEDGVDPNNRRVLNLDVGVADSITLTAQFARKATFTAEATDGGSAAVQIKGDEEAPGSYVQAYASQTVVFEATPNTTHVFDGWYDESDKLVSASATYSYTIASETEPDLTLTARFRQPKLTLLMATGGTSISVNGQTCTSGQELPVDKGSSVTLAATADTTNEYSFAYWYYNGKQYDAQWNPTVAGDMTITAFFKDRNGNVPGVARIGGTIYPTLTLALDAAKSGDTVVLITDYTLTESVTVKSGVKLLIPLSDDDAGNFGNPTRADNSNSSVFRTLTVADGAKITVYGAVCVNSRQSSTNGKPVGACGRIELADGAAMEFNSGANLYAYGYVTGAGKVTLHAGANCYECFQILDWPGGGLTVNVFRGSVFPTMQYAFQNVEALMEIEAGAGDYAYYSLTMAGADFQNTVPIIAASGLFKNNGGTVSKQYDSARDRIVVTVTEGSNASTGGIEVKAQAIAIKYTINSSDYECPIFGNVTVRVAKNASLSLGQRYKFLPGAEIIVDEGGILTIEDGGAMYLYDVHDFSAAAHGFSWASYPAAHAEYRTTGKKAITLSEMGSAKLEVNGTLIANGGLYTSNNGDKYNGNVTGGKVITGTGKIQMGEASADAVTITELLNLKSNAPTYTGDKTAITFYRVQAYLAGTDLNTVARLDRNTTYYGVKVGDKTAWYTHKATFVDDTQTLYTVYAQNKSTEVRSGTILNGNGEKVATITDPASKVGYTFSGWSDAGAAAIPTEEVLGQTINKQSYNAIWTAKTTTIKLDDNGGTGGATTVTATYEKLLGTVTTLPTRKGYAFTGYFDQKIGGTQYINNSGFPTRAWDKDAETATLYAHWVPVSCTITVKSQPVAGGDTPIADVSLDGLGTYNLTDSVTFNAPKVKNYTFKGWFVEDASGYSGTPVYTGHVVTEEIHAMVDKGLFDTSTVLNLVAVYESKPETDLTLKLDKAPTGVTVEGGTKNTNNTWSVPVGTEVTINVPTGTNFRCWTNANDKVMSTQREYTFTMVTNTTLTAVTSSDDTFVIFQSADGRLLKYMTTNNLSANDVPAAPYRVGYEFKGWKVGSADPVSADKVVEELTGKTGTVTVTAAYGEITAGGLSVTVYVDGSANTEMSKSNLSLGEIAMFTANQTANNKAFRFWASNVNGTNILSFSRTYSFRVTKGTTIYAIYGDKVTDKPPVVRVDNVLKNDSPQSLTFMIGASIPEGYQLVEMGALYAKTSADDTTLRVENAGKGTAYKAVSRLNHETAPGLADFSYALGFKVSDDQESSKIYLRGYVAVKKTDSTDNTIYYYYSGITFKSYSDFSVQQGG